MHARYRSILTIMCYTNGYKVSKLGETKYLVTFDGYINAFCLRRHSMVSIALLALFCIPLWFFYLLLGSSIIWMLPACLSGTHTCPNNSKLEWGVIFFFLFRSGFLSSWQIHLNLYEIDLTYLLYGLTWILIVEWGEEVCI